jgi:hypothetical protein
MSNPTNLKSNADLVMDLARRMQQLAPDQVLTYGEIAEITGADVASKNPKEASRARGFIQRAKRKAAIIFMVPTETEMKEGVRRLPQAVVHERTDKLVHKVGRAARLHAEQLNTVEVHKLPAGKQSAHAHSLLIVSAIKQASDHGRAMLKTAVAPAANYAQTLLEQNTKAA